MESEDRLSVIKKLCSNPTLEGVSIEYHLKKPFQILENIKNLREKSNGARHAKLVELRPLTTFEDYKIQWRQANTNLSELARLRWIQKLSVAHIAEILDRSPETIQMYICRMRKPEVLAKVNLSTSELSLVKQQINSVFQGK